MTNDRWAAGNLSIQKETKSSAKPINRESFTIWEKGVYMNDGSSSPKRVAWGIE